MCPSNLTGRLWGLGPADDDENLQAEVLGQAGSNGETSLPLAAPDAEICFSAPAILNVGDWDLLEGLEWSWRGD